jgi:Uma2 family endonuclease
MGYAGGMASTEAPPSGRYDAAPPLPAQPPAFPGCKPVHLPRTEIERFEGRLEYWDSATETAWICDPATAYHERPSRLLTRLAERIAEVRGSPIESYGSMDLLLRDPDGEPRRIMQADESVYLHPARAKLPGAAMVVGEDDFPDVVLEVDHTTDVHRGKLAQYESWGFPEVWVEVPEAPSPSRPHRRRPGLTIHLLEHDRFRVVTESRAFPGWRAEEIHLALNEPVPSAQTSAAVERVAATLGAREGTGPDDDPLLRSQRRQAIEFGRAEGRAEGHAEGRAEGRLEGRAEARAQMVRQILRSRGIEVTARFDTATGAVAAASEEALLTAALGCTDEADFLAALLQVRDQR